MVAQASGAQNGTAWAAHGVGWRTAHWPGGACPRDRAVVAERGLGRGGVRSRVEAAHRPRGACPRGHVAAAEHGSGGGGVGSRVKATHRPSGRDGSQTRLLDSGTARRPRAGLGGSARARKWRWHALMTSGGAAWPAGG